MSLSNFLLTPQNGKQAFWVDSNRWGKFAKKLTKLSNDFDFVGKFARDCRASGKSLVQSSKKLKESVKKGKTVEELVERWLKYEKDVTRHSNYYAWGLLPIDKNLENILKEKIKEEGISEGYLDIFTEKIRLNENEREKRKLLKIASRVKENGYTEEVERKLEEHRNKYGWYPVYDYALKPWSIDDFKGRIKEIKNEAEKKIEEKKEPEEIEAEINEALDEVGADQELRDLVNLVQEYLFLRTYRTNVLRKAYYNLKPFLEEVAKGMGWSKDLIPYFSKEELEKYLKNEEKPDKEEIKGRKDSFLFLMKGGDINIYSEKSKIKEIMRRELPEVKEVEKLEGVGIYPGTVENEAKIVESAESADKLKEGEILVASMTTPDMHSSIEKAGAIVTDEGGMTSHAALVSKELKIPCIIGTEKATDVLEDGQKVKVDAEKGIVEVLE